VIRSNIRVQGLSIGDDCQVEGLNDRVAIRANQGRGKLISDMRALYERSQRAGGWISIADADDRRTFVPSYGGLLRWPLRAQSLEGGVLAACQAGSSIGGQRS